MNIIILGAGQVGSTLAEQLQAEDNDITLVDIDPRSLERLQDLDIRTIEGLGSHPHILRKAGAAQAHMLIAVTASDEVNMIACQIAHTLFDIPKKIARIRSPHYYRRNELFASGAIPIDVLISPEQVVTNYMLRLIEFPGALQVLDFADGKVRLVAVRTYRGGPLVGSSLSEISDKMPDLETRVAALYRNGHAIALSGDTVIEAGDEIFFIAASEHIRSVMGALGRLDNPYKRIMIAGGGNVGIRLAEALEHNHHVKIIDCEPERTEWLANQLDNTTVLLGNASDRELLLEENIEHVDLFCSVTNDEEANIMAALQAKRLGAHHVMALINRTAYVELIDGGDIDVAISPQQATIGNILTHIRQADAAAVHALRHGAAEAIELIAHGNEKTSKVIGRAIEELKLPATTSIGAIVRQDDVIIAHHDTVIEAEDHVLLFLTDKRHIHHLEKLFLTGATA